MLNYLSPLNYVLMRLGFFKMPFLCGPVPFPEIFFKPFFGLLGRFVSNRMSESESSDSASSSSKQYFILLATLLNFYLMHACQ